MVAACEDVIAAFADALEPALRERVAGALFNKAIAFGDLGRLEEAIDAYEDVVARFSGAAGDRRLRDRVAKALFNKGVTLGELGRLDEAVAAYEDLVGRFADADELGSAPGRPARSSTRPARSA